MKGINCKNCEWSWDIEKGDKNPFLCHNCGYDNKKNEFDFQSLEDWKKENNINPYKESINEKGAIQRSFSKTIHESELVWHRDSEDRLVYPVKDSDWMFQFENEIPKYLELQEAIYIPKNTYHRLIKGTNDLDVEIYKVINESEENENLNENKKKKDDRCTRIAKRKYDTWPSAYASGAVVRCRKGKIWKDLSEKEIEFELEEASKKKTDYSKEKESGLHGWFSRQGAKGSSSGWVDCNTCRKDKKTGKKTCKSCGRKDGEKRSKYPACRPTPSDCGTKGKGKKWGKKSKRKNENISITKEGLKTIIKEAIKESWSK